MTRFLRLLATAISLAAISAKATAVDASLEQVQKSGTLRVALDPSYPPMESEGQSGKLEGFSIDFAAELAARLKAKPNFMTMNWDGILAGLNSGRYDVIISTMNITEERKKQVDFVEYLRMSQVFVSKKGREIKTEKELSGLMISVAADTTSFAYVEKRRKVDPTIKGVRAFPLMGDAFAELRNGKADVLVVDEPVGRYYAKNAPNDFVVSGTATSPEPVGIALRKDAAALRAAVQAALDAMKADGTFKALSTKWFAADLGS